MEDSDDFEIPREQIRLHEIAIKVFRYQSSLPDDRAVELDELRSEGVLSSADDEFLTMHSVTYKPHHRSDYHAMDMFHMPTDDGGCVYIGPSAPPMTKRSASLNLFQPIVENFLKLPAEDLLLHIEFTEHDGMAVGPEMICFDLRSETWRNRLPAIRSVAAELGFNPHQDEQIQGGWMLTFFITPDASRTAAATVALLSRGCGLAQETEIVYSAGALD